MPPAAAPPRPGQAAGTIRRSVVDERTDQPLARVLVRLADTDYGATTGADGRFELRGVTPGDYTATVSVVGYALLRERVSVRPGAVLAFTFVLTAGTGTYEEKVDVVAPVFEQREPGGVAEQTIGATELQDLRGLVADARNRGDLGILGLRSTGRTWSLAQHVYWQVNAFQNRQPAGLEAGSGRFVDAGYRLDFTLTVYASLRLWSRATAVAKCRAGSQPCPCS